MKTQYHFFETIIYADRGDGTVWAAPTTPMCTGWIQVPDLPPPKRCNRCGGPAPTDQKLCLHCEENPDVMELESAECQSCAAKPGAPLLCSGCISNRDVVSDLKEEIQRLRGLLQEASGVATASVSTRKNGPA